MHLAPLEHKGQDLCRHRPLGGRSHQPEFPQPEGLVEVCVRLRKQDGAGEESMTGDDSVDHKMT